MPGFRSFELQNIGAQQRRGQLVARVAAGLHKIGHDIRERRHADAAVRRRFFLAERLYTLTQLSDAVGAHIRLRIAAQGEQLFRRGVRLRMDAGRVENVFPLRHAQEARALLKRLRPDARHLFELRRATVYAPFASR